MHKSNINQNIYHLSTGKETSLDDLVDIFSRITHKKINVEYLPFRNGEVYRNFADYSKAKKELDFNPSLIIDTLLEETFNWYKYFIK